MPWTLWANSQKVPVHAKIRVYGMGAPMYSDVIGPKVESTQSQTLVSRGLNLCVSESLDLGEFCVQQQMSSSGGEEGSYRPNEEELMQIGQKFRDRFFLSDAEDSFWRRETVCWKNRIGRSNGGHVSL